MKKFTKKFTALALAFMMVFGVLILANPTTIYANDEISVTIDGVVVDFEGQPPTIVDGRTLVPVRGVFEALGFEVDWDSDTRTVSLTSDIYVVLITVDSATFTTNGTSYTLDVPAQIINGRTMLPIRAVLESIGYFVDWDSTTRTVLISVENVYDNVYGEIDFTPFLVTQNELDSMNQNELTEFIRQLRQIEVRSSNLEIQGDIAEFISALEGGNLMSANQNRISNFASTWNSMSQSEINNFIGQLEQAIFDEVNRYRQRHGVSALENHASLQIPSREHSQDIAIARANGIFIDNPNNLGSPIDRWIDTRTGDIHNPHHGSNGSRPHERVTDGSLGFVAENMNFLLLPTFNVSEQAVAVVNSWSNSPPHRANMLNDQHEFGGVGIATFMTGSNPRIVITNKFARMDWSEVGVTLGFSIMGVTSSEVVLTGAGNHREHMSVNISAQPATSGVEFVRWEVGRGNFTIADPYSPNTTVTLGSAANNFGGALVRAIFRRTAENTPNLPQGTGGTPTQQELRNLEQNARNQINTALQNAGLPPLAQSSQYDEVARLLTHGTSVFNVGVSMGNMQRLSYNSLFSQLQLGDAVLSTEINFQKPDSMIK